MLLITVLARATEKVNQYFTDRIHAQRLEYLDDRLLRDIGLAREFGRIVSYDYRDEQLAEKYTDREDSSG